MKQLMWCLLLIIICSNQQIVGEVLNFAPYNLVEKKFPDFVFPDDQNKLYSSKNLIGKWHMLCFLPKGSGEQVNLYHMKEIYEWLNAQDVAIVCVSSSSSDDLKELRLKYDLPPFVLLSDYGGERSRMLTREKTRHYSTIFLIDERGIVKEVFNKWSEINIVDVLTFFMKKQLSVQVQPEKTRWVDPVPPTTYDLAGKEAPQFQLPDDQGKLHDLVDYRGKWCILFFLPDSSKYYEVSRCFDGAYGWLKSQNVELIGISNDSVDKIAQDRQRFKIQHLFLSDTSSTVALQYFIKYNDFAAVIIDERGFVQRVMKKSWAEEYLVELLLFFIKKDTSVAKTSSLPKSRVCETLPTKVNYNGYGDEYSNFDAPDELGKWHKLSDCRGKWCVLFFPIDRSDECIDHVFYASELYDWLHNHGVEVVCVSTLELEALARIKKNLHLKFLMLNDFNKAIGDAYGVYDWCGDIRMTLILNEKGESAAIEEGGSPMRHIMSPILFFMKKFVR